MEHTAISQILPVVEKNRLDWRLGLAGLAGLSTHQTALAIYHGSSGCGEFTDQVTNMSGLRLFFEMPVFRSPSVLVVGSVAWQNRPITFAETFTNPARYLDGVTEEVVTQHRLDASMQTIRAIRRNALGASGEPPAQPCSFVAAAFGEGCASIRTNYQSTWSDVYGDG